MRHETLLYDVVERQVVNRRVGGEEVWRVCSQCGFGEWKLELRDTRG